MTPAVISLMLFYTSFLSNSQSYIVMFPLYSIATNAEAYVHDSYTAINPKFYKAAEKLS